MPSREPETATFDPTWARPKYALIPTRAVRDALPPLGVDATSAWRTIQSEYEAHGKLRADAFIKNDAPLLRRAHSLCGSKAVPPVKDPWTEAAAALPTSPAAFVDRWRAAGGVAAATRGVLETVRFQAERGAGVGLRIDVAAGLIRLRAHLARADDVAYEAALAVADETLGGAKKMLGDRWRAGALFPERSAWMDEFVEHQRELVRARMFEIDDHEVRLLRAALRTWSDVGQHLEYAAKMSRYLPNKQVWRDDADSLFPQLVASGVATSLASKLVDQLVSPEHLAALPSDRAYARLLTNRALKNYGSALERATRAFPRRAAPPSEEGAERKAARRSVASTAVDRVPLKARHDERVAAREQSRRRHGLRHTERRGNDHPSGAQMHGRVQRVLVVSPPSTSSSLRSCFDAPRLVTRFL